MGEKEKEEEEEEERRKWGLVAEELHDLGASVYQFFIPGEVSGIRKDLNTSLIGPEFSETPVVTTLHSSGKQAHPTSFHGKHRWIRMAHRNRVGIPLFRQMEQHRLKNEKEHQSSRKLEMLINQIVVNTNTQPIDTDDRPWFYEECPLIKDGDDVYLGFINLCNNKTIYVEMVPGSHLTTIPKHDTMVLHASMYDQKIYEENQHKTFVVGETAKTYEKTKLRIAVEPGAALVYNSRLVVRDFNHRPHPSSPPLDSAPLDSTPLDSTPLDSATVLVGLCYRLTHSYLPLHKNIANVMTRQGVPVMYHGRYPTLYGPCKPVYITDAEREKLYKWTGIPGAAEPKTFVSKCVEQHVAELISGEHVEFLLPHRILRSLKSYRLPLFEEYSREETIAHFPSRCLE